MRILFVNPVGQLGGAERVMLDCIASIHQAESGHEIHVLLMEEGALAEEARKAGAEVSVLPAPARVRKLGDSALKMRRGALASAGALWRMICATPAVLFYTRALRRRVAAVAPDVIHSNGLKSHFLVARAKVKIPVVWHIHDFVGARPMMARLLRRVARDAKPIAVSNAIAEDVRRWLPGSAPEVVMNGVDVERFSPGPGDGARLDALAGMSPAPAGTVRVGLVATYARWKGQDVFLRAVKKVMENRPRQPVRFYIVGGPIYATRGSQYSREELESMARELGVAEHVGLVPFQADPVPAYRALDIVVHASTQPEPFGLTIAEAMACGRAMVVSNGGGIGEMLEDGVNGIGITPGDVDTMALVIGELMEVPSRRAGLGESARTFALGRLDRRPIGPAILSTYWTLTNPS